MQNFINYFEKYINYERLIAEIDLIKKINLLKIYLVYISFVVICSIIFSFLYIQRFPDQIESHTYNVIIKNIPFFFGDLIYNLVYENRYIQEINGINFYLARHPVLPIFLATLLKISKNFFLFVIAKNIVTFTIYFIFSYIFLLNNKNKILTFILILFVPVVIPYNFNVALQYVYEDCLLAIIVPLLLLNLISKNKYKSLYTSALLFLLYLIKGTTFFIILLMPFLILFFDNKKKFSKFPLIAAISAIIIWGAFGFYKTGKFPFFHTKESTNSFHLSAVLDKNFKNYYPDVSTDILVKYPDNKINSEWEFYDYYNIKNKNYLKENYAEYFLNIVIKLKFIFFGIKIDGLSLEKKLNSHYENPIRYSSIFGKFFLNFALLVGFFALINNRHKFLKKKLEIYFFSITILYLAPFVIAWATSKHLVPLINASMIYLIFYYCKKFNLAGEI
jgi:hypothetical protein